MQRCPETPGAGGLCSPCPPWKVAGGLAGPFPWVVEIALHMALARFGWRWRVPLRGSSLTGWGAAGGGRPGVAGVLVVLPGEGTDLGRFGGGGCRTGKARSSPRRLRPPRGRVCAHRPLGGAAAGVGGGGGARPGRLRLSTGSSCCPGARAGAAPSRLAADDITAPAAGGPAAPPSPPRRPPPRGDWPTGPPVAARPAPAEPYIYAVAKEKVTRMVRAARGTRGGRRAGQRAREAAAAAATHRAGARRAGECGGAERSGPRGPREPGQGCGGGGAPARPGSARLAARVAAALGACARR